MTSAHRPTFNPAIGRSQAALTVSTSAKEQAVQPLKFRELHRRSKPGQNTADELSQRDLREELLAREEKVAAERAKKERRPGDDLDYAPAETKRLKLVPDEIAKLDADEDDDDDEDDSDDDDDDDKRPSAAGPAGGAGEADDDDDDDDDDTAELLRELERIKKERAEEQQRAAKLKADEQERIRTEQILVSNPLLNQPADYSLKKKWYDDVIFKNCAKSEPEVKKRFINDTIRSDFHRKFLSKYVA